MTAAAGRFADRADAGRQLAHRLAERTWTDPVVLALPRGGVGIAVAVASALDAPLDVVVARKLPAPGRPEYGIGAVAEDGEPLYDAEALRYLDLAPEDLTGVLDEQRRELARRVAAYRGDRPLPDVAGRDVLVVDDGLATGVTARAAVRALAPRGPRRVVVAVPVGSPAAVATLEQEADEVVCLHAPARFRAVGSWYRVFEQVSDATVLALLDGARK